MGGFAPRQDDIVVLQSAGGGGCGDPLERPAAEVAEDEREGYGSAEHARALYGVVVAADGSLDMPSTEPARRHLAAARLYLAVWSVTSMQQAVTAAIASARCIPKMRRRWVSLRVISSSWSVIHRTGLARLGRYRLGCPRGTVPLNRLGRTVTAATPGSKLYLRALRRSGDLR